MGTELLEHRVVLSILHYVPLLLKLKPLVESLLLGHSLQ